MQPNYSWEYKLYTPYNQSYELEVSPLVMNPIVNVSFTKDGIPVLDPTYFNAFCRGYYKQLPGSGTVTEINAQSRSSTVYGLFTHLQFQVYSHNERYDTVIVHINQYINN